MRNLKFAFSLIMAVCLLASSAIAQNTNVFSFTTTNAGVGTAPTNAYKVVTNSGTGALYAPYKTGISTGGYEGFITVQAALSNASGTTAGNIFLQGSLDSLTWDYIYGANGMIGATNTSLGIGGATAPSGIDTFVATATHLNKTWFVNTLRYPYLRVYYVGSGTHSDTLRVLGKLYMRR